jgi:hypothetical protein
MKSALWQLFYLPVITVLIPSVAALGDCTQRYPDSDVAIVLENDDFKKCVLDVMVQSYADLLQTKHQLLTALRPAYSRKLAKDVADAAITIEASTDKLAAYDKKLSDLLTRRASLDSWLAQVRNDTGTSGMTSITTENKSALQAHLIKCEKASQALNRKSKQLEAVITGAERNDFCLMDFKFRIGEKLNPMIGTCLKSNP